MTSAAKHGTARMWILGVALALVVLWSWAPWIDASEDTPGDVVQAARRTPPRSDLSALTSSASSTTAGAAPRPTHAARPLLSEQSAGHLFGSGRSAPPPTRAPVAPAPAPAVQEPVAQVQPAFAVRGLVRQAGEPLRALVETPDGQLRALAVGDLAHADWKVRALNGSELLVEHLPTHTQRALPLPSES